MGEKVYHSKYKVSYDTQTNKSADTKTSSSVDIENEQLNKQSMPYKPNNRTQEFNKAVEALHFDTSLRDWIWADKRPTSFNGRTAVMQAVDVWISSSTPRTKKYLLISGALGTGKSALVTHIIDYINSRELGKVDVFFCEASIDGTRHASTLIKFIANFLYRIFGDNYFSSDIINYLKDDVFIRDSADRLFAKLIFNPILKLNPEAGKQYFLIIDALDEMISDQCQVFLDLMNRFNPPRWLNIIMTSREEQLIIRSLERSSICISLNNPQSNLTDVEDYFREELPDKDESYIKDLAKRSEGNFLYAKYLSEEIRLTGDISIHSLPYALDGLYDVMLKRKYESLGANDEFDRDARPIFEVLVAAKSPISINEISNVIGVDIREINRRMQKISSFVTLPPSRSMAPEIRIFNPSFVSYLTNNNGNIYYIDKNMGIQLFLNYIERTKGEVLLPDRSKYFSSYGLLHIIEEKASGVLEELLRSPNEQIPDIIENELFFIYIKNSKDVIDTLKPIPIEILRRIILTTYRKGISYSIYETDSDDEMSDLISLLCTKGEIVRALMLEGERYQRKRLYDQAEEKFIACMEEAKRRYSDNPTIWSKRYIALTYNRLGNLANEKERNGNKPKQKSRDYYAEGYKIFKEIVDLKDDDWNKYRLVYIKDLAIATARIGDLEIISPTPDLDVVFKHYEEYNRYCLTLSAAKPNSIAFLRELATSYRRLGDFNMLCNIFKAYNLFLESLTILHKIVEIISFKERPNIDSQFIKKIDERDFDRSTCSKNFILFPYEHREPDYLREHVLCFMRLAHSSYIIGKKTLALYWSELAEETCTVLDEARKTKESSSDLKIAIDLKNNIKGE